MQHRDLLGVRGDDEVARAEQPAADVGRDGVRVALVVELARARVEPERDEERQREQPEPPGARRARRRASRSMSGPMMEAK